MSTALQRRNRPRRGVTLVEMLVVVALVVLMMVILVQIFQSALGAMSASRTTQELDVVLRSIDSMIRTDLAGVTAKLTPPNNPALKQGYFEYGENAPPDLQGEDTDDFLAFTTKAPEGQFFTGRQWLSTSNVSPTNPQLINQAIQPATVTSQVAEVIYFLRNGNLYRRVFLVAPDRSSSIYVPGGVGQFATSIFGGSSSVPVSWQGMNEISCRPSLTGKPIPNDLGDLTNRENRAFRPRFWNDYSSPGNSGSQDGIPDDINADDIPDYYPTLYYDGAGYIQTPNGVTVGWAPNTKVFEDQFLPYPQGNQRVQQGTAYSYDVYAFPYIYPGMYSVPDPLRVGTALGWVHYVTSSTSSLLNHSPLDLGETSGFTLPSSSSTNPYQTWWGFPTWRETMAGGSSGAGWYDPVSSVANNQHQPLGLRPFNPIYPPLDQHNSTQALGLLPTVYNNGTTLTPYGSDQAGSASFIADPISAANPYGPNVVWQDDLILTNVRSFDVKAYDPSAPLYDTSLYSSTGVSKGYLSAGYWDLGYAGYATDTYAPLTSNTSSTIYGPNYSQGTVPWQLLGTEPQGFGHEGRIPPYAGDFRMHPRRGYNIGDNSTGVTRLTHTFDTWSTDYVNAPDSDLLLWEYSAGTPAIYPSFNAPYPSPLSGIQIQIRVTDPRSERTKVLTIRHDFTDKL